MDRVYDYDGQHSVTFTNAAGESRNTWTDWGLIPSSRHSEPINGIWSNKVAIPGVNGQEDLVRMYPNNSVNSYSKLRSEILNDNPDYILNTYEYDILQPSSGSLSFIIADQEESFFSKSQTILNFLHNQQMIMRLSDDPSKTYYVRTIVGAIQSGETFSSITISFNVVHEEES